jgi:hypothetical protein
VQQQTCQQRSYQYLSQTVAPLRPVPPTLLGHVMPHNVDTPHLAPPAIDQATNFGAVHWAQHQFQQQAQAVGNAAPQIAPQQIIGEQRPQSAMNGQPQGSPAKRKRGAEDFEPATERENGPVRVGHEAVATNNPANGQQAQRPRNRQGAVPGRNQALKLHNQRCPWMKCPDDCPLKTQFPKYYAKLDKESYYHEQAKLETTKLWWRSQNYPGSDSGGGPPIAVNIKINRGRTHVGN